MNLKGKMDEFFYPNENDKTNKDPGLTSKLGWFYNHFVDNFIALNSGKLYELGIKNKLNSRFIGFFQLVQYRNDIAHGKIDRTISNLENAETLRKQAKDIVDELYKIAEQEGTVIPRVIPYKKAIGIDFLNELNNSPISFSTESSS